MFSAKRELHAKQNVKAAQHVIGKRKIWIGAMMSRNITSLFSNCGLGINENWALDGFPMGRLRRVVLVAMGGNFSPVTVVLVRVVTFISPALLSESAELRERVDEVEEGRMYRVSGNINTIIMRTTCVC